MCAAAISFARIRRLYFGAADPKGGAVEHGPRFFRAADLPPRAGDLSAASARARRLPCSKPSSPPAAERLTVAQHQVPIGRRVPEAGAERFRVQATWPGRGPASAPWRFADGSACSHWAPAFWRASVASVEGLELRWREVLDGWQSPCLELLSVSPTNKAWIAIVSARRVRLHASRQLSGRLVIDEGLEKIQPPPPSCRPL